MALEPGRKARAMTIGSGSSMHAVAYRRPVVTSVRLCAYIRQRVYLCHRTCPQISSPWHSAVDGRVWASQMHCEVRHVQLPGQASKRGSTSPRNLSETSKIASQVRCLVNSSPQYMLVVFRRLCAIFASVAPCCASEVVRSLSWNKRNLCNS